MASSDIPSSSVPANCRNRPPPNVKDIAGKRFGRLVAIGFSHVDKWRSAHWWFECDCGNRKVIKQSSVHSGATKSCECLHREKARLQAIALRKPTAGCPRLRNILNGMRSRCYNRDAVNYERYGGRGVTVCKEWRTDNEEFYRWAVANGYAENLELNRKNNAKGYSADNCEMGYINAQSEQQKQQSKD